MNEPPFLWVYMYFLCIALATAVPCGLGAALKLAGNAAAGTRQVVRSAAGLLFGWLAIVALLGRLDVFRPAVDRPIPYIAFAIVIPVACGARLINRWNLAVTILRAAPQGWLVGVQCYRGAGAIFLILYGMHFMPGVFAVPAGIGDVLVGLLALPVAALYRKGSRIGNAAVVAWNALGILDLVAAITLGFLSAPTRFQVLAHDAPNAMIGSSPAALIPTFAVPLSIILHLASLKKIALEKQDAGQAAAAN